MTKLVTITVVNGRSDWLRCKFDELIANESMSIEAPFAKGDKEKLLPQLSGVGIRLVDGISCIGRILEIEIELDEIVVHTSSTCSLETVLSELEVAIAKALVKPKQKNKKKKRTGYDPEVKRDLNEIFEEK